MVDLPYAHFPVFGNVNFFSALADSNNMEIFESLAIRAIIESQWPTSQRAIIAWLMRPSIFFLVFIIFYTLIIFETYAEQLENRSDHNTYKVTVEIYRSCQAILVIFLLYFTSLEIVQMRKSIKQYFKSVWNYFDLIVIIIIMLTIILDVCDVNPKIQRRLYAICIFVMWIKTMYYLRVYRKVGYLTSMIIKVLADLRFFMLILAMSIAAFANAFLILSLNNEEEN